MSKQHLHVFVYGTLKKGFWNHAPYCGGYISLQKAIIPGRLFRKPSGTPILEVPDHHILARGTADRAADIETVNHFNGLLNQNKLEHEVNSLDHSWDMVSGELITFDPSPERLKNLDDLEEFLPPDLIIYSRSLMRVFPNGANSPIIAWVYTMKPRQNHLRMGPIWTGPRD